MKPTRVVLGLGLGAVLAGAALREQAELGRVRGGRLRIPRRDREAVSSMGRKRTAPASTTASSSAMP